LTRQSILFAKFFPGLMDARIKSGHDDRNMDADPALDPGILP